MSPIIEVLCTVKSSMLHEQHVWASVKISFDMRLLEAVLKNVCSAPYRLGLIHELLAKYCKTTVMVGLRFLATPQHF